MEYGFIGAVVHETEALLQSLQTHEAENCRQQGMQQTIDTGPTMCH